MYNPTNLKVSNVGKKFKRFTNIKTKLNVTLQIFNKNSLCLLCNQRLHVQKTLLTPTTISKSRQLKLKRAKS